MQLQQTLWLFRFDVTPPCGLRVFNSGGSRCLDAVLVVLHQAHEAEEGDGQIRRRYLSTLELQLVSLEFCMACRSIPTLHVRIVPGAPPTLWTPRGNEARETPQRHSMRGRKSSRCLNVPDKEATFSPSRVPMVRAARLTWRLRAQVLVKSGTMERWKGLEWMRLEGGGDSARLESVVWPPRLKRLVLDTSLETPAREITWPAHLEQLSFGCCFDKPIAGVVWPASLQQLSFGYAFNQSIAEVKWPASLKELSFGQYFNQPIAGVEWPVSLQRLSLGNAFNQPITEILWPASLRQESLGYVFNQSIAGVAWPASVQRLAFGACFNQPIAGVVWPPSLTELLFWNNFSQPVAETVWPPSLKYFSVGSRKRSTRPSNNRPELASGR